MSTMGVKILDRQLSKAAGEMGALITARLAGIGRAINGAAEHERHLASVQLHAYRLGLSDADRDEVLAAWKAGSAGRGLPMQWQWAMDAMERRVRGEVWEVRL